MHRKNISIAYYIQFHHPIVDLFFVETSHTIVKIVGENILSFFFITESRKNMSNMNQINDLDFHNEILCYDLFEGYLSHVLL